MTTTQKKSLTSTATHVATKISVKVIGVGGAGANILAQLAGSKFSNAAFALVNTDADANAGLPEAEKFVLDVKLARGKYSEAALVEHLAGLKTFCDGADVVFVVAGLGGVAGTAFSPILTRMAKESGALTLAFATLPFECEGSRRIQRSRQGLEELRAAADAVICLPNQKILKLTDENTSVSDAFRIANELLADGVHGVWRLLAHRGLIEIHFDDFCALFRDQSGESVFAVAEASGKTRSRELMEKLLAHPMLEGGQLLNESETVLVSLLGGRDMTMAEVTRIMELINRQCENAQVIMGAAIDDKFKDRLAITLIATQRNPDNKIESEPAPEPMSGISCSRLKTSGAELTDHLLGETTVRPSSRFIAPPPETTPEKVEQLTRDVKSRRRTNKVKMQQAQLPLEIISKGRFEKSEPTIYKGEDLDYPTYIRRGIALN